MLYHCVYAVEADRGLGLGLHGESEWLVGWWDDEYRCDIRVGRGLVMVLLNNVFRSEAISRLVFANVVKDLGDRNAGEA